MESCGPELFIGLAGAVGTDLELVHQAVSDSLKSVGYQSSLIHLAGLLRKLPAYASVPNEPLDDYIGRMMDAGDDFRKKLDRSDAVALLAIASIHGERSSGGE